jgi:hypothetical protein
MLHPNELETEIQKELFKRVDFDFDRSVVAFKGGILEKKLLNNLGVCSFNLERWGCPKYDDLLKSVDPTYKSIADRSDCGRHTYVPNPKFVQTNGGGYHCSASEVAVFKYWLERNYSVLLYQFGHAQNAPKQDEAAGAAAL